jgi:hypothetical protein
VSALAFACSCGWPEPQVRVLELNTDATLFDVAYGESGVFAVGQGGVVVHDRGMTWQLGDVDLRSIDIYVTHRDTVAIVGDDGFITYGVGDTLESFAWFEQAAGTNADLRDVIILVLYPAQLLVVGDGIVLRGIELELGVFEWSEPPAPDGGWGSLRAVAAYDSPPFTSSNQDRVLVAVGDDGRVLSSDDDGLAWTAHALDTDADLRCLANDGAYGERGTWARLEGNEWQVAELDPAIDPAIDIVACDGAVLVSADQRVHDLENDLTFELDWQPHAVEMRYLVGEAGNAGYVDNGGPHEF